MYQKDELERFKARLLAEKAELEEELSGIGTRNPNNPDEWDPTSGGLEVDSADENEVADKLEELEDNSSIAAKLEGQLKEVEGAIGRIEKGTYGMCEICNKPIEPERLEANPSARISIKHKHS